MNYKLIILGVLLILLACEQVKDSLPEVTLIKLINHPNEFHQRSIVSFGYVSFLEFEGNSPDPIFLYPSKDQADFWDRISRVYIGFSSVEAKKIFIENCNHKYISFIGLFKYHDLGNTIELAGFTEKQDRPREKIDCYFEYNEIKVDFYNKKSGRSLDS